MRFTFDIKADLRLILSVPRLWPKNLKHFDIGSSFQLLELAVDTSSTVPPVKHLAHWPLRRRFRGIRRTRRNVGLGRTIAWLPRCSGLVVGATRRIDGRLLVRHLYLFLFLHNGRSRGRPSLLTSLTGEGMLPRIRAHVKARPHIWWGTCHLVTRSWVIAAGGAARRSRACPGCRGAAARTSARRWRPPPPGPPPPAPGRIAPCGWECRCRSGGRWRAPGGR